VRTQAHQASLTRHRPSHRPSYQLQLNYAIALAEHGEKERAQQHLQAAVGIWQQLDEELRKAVRLRRPRGYSCMAAS
jgi:hypothetical protein